MKNVILIKSHPSVRLGHIYEHLFMFGLKKYFYRNELYKGLDYAAGGATYTQGGIIEIDCELYSEKAKQLSDEISALTIEFNTIDINRALYQIMAEEQARAVVINQNRFMQELHSLDNEPWQHIDTMNTIDTKKIRLKNGVIGYSREPRYKPRLLEVTLSLDKSFAESHRDLAPLFGEFSRWILLTVTDVITYHQGYYGGELYGKPKPLSVTSELWVTPGLIKIMDLEHLATVISDNATIMCTPSKLKQFCDNLSSLSYSKRMYEAPSQERILYQSDHYIGVWGWQKITSVENIELLGKNINIELKFGRKKFSQHLRLSQ